MTDSSFVRFAGACAILACPTALVSFFLGPVAFGGDFDAVFDPFRAIAHPGVRVALVRWGWVLDIAGYYFLLFPAVLAVGAITRGTAPLLTKLCERLALGYMITGASGAAILAGTTDLFGRYAEADPAGRAVIAEVYAMLFGLVYEGLWNTLCMSLLAGWLLFGGTLLARVHPWSGRGMVVLGACSALDVAGGLAGAEGISMLGLFGYLFGFPIWSAALGLALVRGGASEAAHA